MPFFTPRERAALAWAEAVTEIGRTGVPEALLDQVRAQFTDAELVTRTMAVIAINGWNRLSISFGTEPGSYQAGTGRRTSPSEAPHAPAP